MDGIRVPNDEIDGEVNGEVDGENPWLKPQGRAGSIHQQNGFSFIEILVALFLLATGALSLSAFQLANLKIYQHNFQLMQGRELLRHGAEFLVALQMSTVFSRNTDFDVNDFMLSIGVDETCVPVQACAAQFCNVQQFAADYHAQMQCLAKQIHPSAVLSSYCVNAPLGQRVSCSTHSLLYFELIWPSSANEELVDCQRLVFDHQRCVFSAVRL